MNGSFFHCFFIARQNASLQGYSRSCAKAGEPGLQGEEAGNERKSAGLRVRHRQESAYLTSVAGPDSCGSGLARDGITPVYLNNRAVRIASKPAPTEAGIA
ncbi:hypothetical protein TU76_02925 [Pseudomonas psychrophila]|nr:hypothetical protein TU76_02925 [Pseudomonas psychrophila]